MQLFSFAHSRQRKERDAVARDAAALLEIWGDTACDVARDLAWREDFGWLATTVPGHWGRVSDAVNARLGVAQPSADAWLTAA